MLTNLRFERVPWTIGGALSLCLHATVAASLILQLNLSRASPSPPVAPMVVELAQLPTAPTLPQNDIPIGAKQQQQQTQSLPKPLVKRLPFDPPPQAPTSPPPQIAIAKQENQPRTDTASKTVEQTTAPVAVEAKPDRELTAPASADAHLAEADAEASWAARLLAKLESQKRYPRASQNRHEEDAVYVKFAVDRRGNVLPGTVVVRSNGYPLLDAEALDLFKRASPLPPPPPEVYEHKQEVEETVAVGFYLRAATH